MTFTDVTLADDGFLDIGASRLEYRMTGPRPCQAPTVVMLHEGLGSAGLWGEFPMRLAQATGLGVFAYSRPGYGASTPSPLPWPTSFMHDHAREVLPRVLDAISLRTGILLGHSDGASIATIFAGSHDDPRIRGVVLLAPHFFTEDFGIAAIARTRQAYETTDLRMRLARRHRDPDNAFRGWSGVWLDPAFRSWDITAELAAVRAPVLVIQGADDQYGTVRQVEVAGEVCRAPVKTVMLPATRHAPHRDQPAATLNAIAAFCRPLVPTGDGG